MIFSLDATISFSIMLIGVLVFASIFAQNLTNTREEIQNFELEEKTLMIADSLVKNYDENNTLLGACILDTDKKRVLTNQLSIKNLQKAKVAEFGEVIATKITAKTQTQNTTITLDNNIYKNCLTARRFALIDGAKGNVEVTTCRKD